jgi:hypothetical protein
MSDLLGKCFVLTFELRRISFGEKVLLLYIAGKIKVENMDYLYIRLNLLE